MTLSDFAIGDRIQMHPATDTWMRGDRYGTVVKIGHKYLHVKMDRSGRTLRVIPDNIDATWSLVHIGRRLTTCKKA